jgi:hypothetical protein
MSLSEESAADVIVTSESKTADRPKIQDRLTNDTFTRDTLTKGDRLDIAYLPALPEVIPTVIMPEPPAESVAAAGPTPDEGAKEIAEQSAKPSSPRSSAPRVHRTIVMLPRPRPRIRLAKTGQPADPAVEKVTCFQPDSLSSILLAFSGQPRCS